MKKTLFLLSILGVGLSLFGCSSAAGFTNVGKSWHEEPGLEKIVLTKDAIEIRGVIITPIKVLNARMVKRDGSKWAIHAQGYEFFYVRVQNQTKRSGYVEFVIRYRLTTRDAENKDIEKPTTIEKKYKIPVYPKSGRFIQSSFPETPPETERINEEYQKLLSVNPAF